MAMIRNADVSSYRTSHNKMLPFDKFKRTNSIFGKKVPISSHSLNPRLKFNYINVILQNINLLLKYHINIIYNFSRKCHTVISVQLFIYRNIRESNIPYVHIYVPLISTANDGRTDFVLCFPNIRKHTNNYTSDTINVHS